MVNLMFLTLQNPPRQSVHLAEISKLAEDRQDSSPTSRNQQNFKDRAIEKGA